MSPALVLALSLSAAASAAAASAPSAPAPAAPDPSARPTPEALKAVDDLLAKAEAKVAALESAARGVKDGDGCPPGVGMKELTADLRGRRLAKQLGGDLPDDAGGAKTDWQVYHVCRALAAGDPAPCADADAIAAVPGDYQGAAHAPATYRRNCETAYHQTRAVAARLRGDPRRAEVCRDALPRLADFKSPAAVDDVCRAFDADRGAPHEALLAAMSAGLVRAMERPYLLDAIGEMTADPKRCAKVANGYLAASCRALDEYRGVLARKSACASGLCRVLDGGGEAACEVYARSVLRPVCASAYSAAYASDARDAFETLQGRAQAALDALDAGARGAAELAAVGARLDRLYAQRARFDLAHAAYVPGSAVAPPAPPKRSP